MTTRAVRQDRNPGRKLSRVEVAELGWGGPGLVWIPGKYLFPIASDDPAIRQDRYGMAIPLWVITYV